jgi:hypothetical protein
LTTQKIVIFRIDFNEGQTWIQLLNGKIDEKANDLYIGVKNVKNIETHRNNDFTTHHSR